MLQPKRTKFRKMHKGRNRGLAQRGSKVSFGEFGLKASGRGRLTARQIEAARRAMTRHIKRGGKIWIRVFPDKPITNKPLEVRMGKGKGAPEYWAAPVNPGRMLFEIDGVQLEMSSEVLEYIVSKAIELKLGARGLRSICEAILTDAMFDAPNSKVNNLKIDLNYAKEKFLKSKVNQLKVA